ncbi:MAG: M23 family metallopeptidase [Bacteroidota bacterium]|nr:M23 family metallopeptidase [Bacteroidota bacterium]
MTSGNVRERKEKRRYTFVIVPDVKSEKTRTFSITRWGFVILGVSTIIVFTTLILGLIIYTPFGANLPISNPELEQQYNKQIFDIQKQVQTLVQELTLLRSYNIQLRKVMGEHISSQDSAMMTRSGIETTPFDTIFDIDKMDTTYLSSKEEDGSTLQMPTSLITLPFGKKHKDIRDYISTLPLVMPVSGYITREFDSEQLHYGVDFAGKKGSPVFASTDGIIIFANWTYEDGFMVIITHEQGYLTVYKHNQSILKNVGDVVRRGEIIALLGNTGERSTGSHLHFEIWKNGVVQNPNKYLLNIN